MSKVKKLIIVIPAALVVFAAIPWYGVFAYPLPWKITDPADLMFKVEDFRFTDYETSRDFYNALTLMLHDGVSGQL